MPAVSVGFRTLLEYNPANSLISKNLKLKIKKGSSLEELKRSLQSWCWKNLGHSLRNLGYSLSNTYDAKKTAHAINRFVTKNKKFLLSAEVTVENLRKISQNLTDLERKFSKKTTHPSVRKAQEVINALIPEKERLEAQQKVDQESKQRLEQVRQRNLLKLQTLQERYGEDILRLLSQAKPLLAKSLQSDTEAVTDESFALICVLCQDIRLEEPCKSKLHELQSELRSLREKSSETQQTDTISKVLSELRKLSVEYPEQALRIRPLEEALTALSKGASFFSEVPMEEGLMKCLGFHFDEAKNREIGQKQFQKLQKLLIFTDWWYSNPLKEDYSDQVQQCRQDALRERLASLSPSDQEEVLSFLDATSKLQQYVSKRLQDEKTFSRILGLYEKKYPGFKTFIQGDPLFQEEFIRIGSTNSLQKTLLSSIRTVNDLKSFSAVREEESSLVKRIVLDEVIEDLSVYVKRKYMRGVHNIKS